MRSRASRTTPLLMAVIVLLMTLAKVFLVALVYRYA